MQVNHPTPHPSVWTALVALCLLTSGGCWEDGIPTAYRLTTPELALSSAPTWTGAREDDQSVAEINGIPVPAGRLQRALLDAGEGVDPREVLKGIVIEETLAQAALEKGAIRPDTLFRTFERALVARMLEDRFKDRFQPEDLTSEELEMVFRIPAVRGRFNHLDIYSVQDYQWICCDANPQNCESPVGKACFAEGKVTMEAVLQTLTELDPEAEDLPLILDDLKRSADRLTYQAYDFAFDPKSGKQKGGRLFDDDVVATVISTTPGRFAGPVRSAFGWHIPYLKSMLPEVHKDLSDPEVVKEVSAFFHPKFQQRRFLDALAGLLPVLDFHFLAPLYRDWKPEHPPAYTIETYAEALLEMDRTSRKIEDF
ncbi:MAG: hypothetical protein ISR64_06740 [Deltaproteobacteria bacterium]|nr:hypothetical protein [Deltaproteobacteria bacterium]